MNILNRIDNKLYLSLNPWFRNRIINPLLKRKLKNKDFTLLCNNCNGACILHDLSLPFNSPFVNLWMKPTDFLKYCLKLETYLKAKLIFLKSGEKDVDYPVAMLNDITIYFQHYKSDEEAQKKWVERTKRIRYNNIYVLWVAKDGFTNNDVQLFDKLPYKKAALIKDKIDHPHIYYIPGFENKPELGLLMDYIPHHYFGKKYYDNFDYISWFNDNYN